MSKINPLELQSQHTIYSIGHSTHSIEQFIDMLQSFKIEILADIRRFPGSRKYPQFNQENLCLSLKNQGIKYIHFESLGGRRTVQKDSTNTRWKNESFRGYADYMQTSAFEKAMLSLEKIAKTQTTAYMCSEAVWWRCHRSMISDYLKAKGWKVLHIMAKGKVQEHAYTSPARIVGDTVLYSDVDMFNQ